MEIFPFFIVYCYLLLWVATTKPQKKWFTCYYYCCCRLNFFIRTLKFKEVFLQRQALINKCHIFLFFLMNIYVEYLPFNTNELLCNTVKEAMELAVISNFHHPWFHKGGIWLGTFWSQALNHVLTTLPRILFLIFTEENIFHYLRKFTFPCALYVKCMGPTRFLDFG